MPLLSLNALVKDLSHFVRDTSLTKATVQLSIVTPSLAAACDSRPSLAKANACLHPNGLWLNFLLHAQSEPHVTFSLSFCLSAQHTFELNVLLCYAWIGCLKLVQLCPQASKVECTTQLGFYSPSYITTYHITSHHITSHHIIASHHISLPYITTHYM